MTTNTQDVKKRGSRLTHGGSKTLLYGVWVALKRRCYLATTIDYKNYGGRGIRVVQEGKEHFEPFRDWALTNGYAHGLEIDRIDNYGNYCPENCRWVTKQVNSLNRRNNVLITANGVTKTMSEWSRELGIDRRTIQSRISYGWSGEKLLLPSKKGNNQYTNYREV